MPRKRILIVKAKKGYLDFGHEVYKGGKKAYNKKHPNYMWGFVKGKLYKKAETPTCSGHGDVDSWRGNDWDYCGRYDAKKKIISCVIHVDKMLSFRKLPKTLVSHLEQTFPKAKKIVTF